MTGTELQSFSLGNALKKHRYQAPLENKNQKCRVSMENFCIKMFFFKKEERLQDSKKMKNVILLGK